MSDLHLEQLADQYDSDPAFHALIAGHLSQALAPAMHALTRIATGRGGQDLARHTLGLVLRSLTGESDLEEAISAYQREGSKALHYSRNHTDPGNNIDSLLDELRPVLGTLISSFKEN